MRVDGTRLPFSASDAPDREEAPEASGKGRTLKVRIRRSAAVILALALQLAFATGAMAAPLAPATDCAIENQTPSIPLGAEARYVVHLWGGSGSYSISFAYGDGWTDTASVTASQATFAHWFHWTGTFTQTAYVSSMGSSVTCTSQTTVW